MPEVMTLEHITILNEVRIFSMYHHLVNKNVDTRFCGFSFLLLVRIRC